MLLLFFPSKSITVYVAAVLKEMGGEMRMHRKRFFLVLAFFFAKRSMSKMVAAADP